MSLLLESLVNLETKTKQLYGLIDETIKSHWVSGEVHTIEKELYTLRLRFVFKNRCEATFLFGVKGCLAPSPSE